MTEMPRTLPTAQSIVIADLISALAAQVPTHRDPNDMCWCSAARDVAGHGHEDRCLKARSALEAAGAFPVGYFSQRGAQQ